ncbi:unnamed protein product [Caenorhabditis sp. 36 PRJEB53466]|nr:unnamed protein product [Caenorhabditis sp. 36 PRJEB53466]
MGGFEFQRTNPTSPRPYLFSRWFPVCLRATDIRSIQCSATTTTTTTILIMAMKIRSTYYLESEHDGSNQKANENTTKNGLPRVTY